jgi:hypothetical protein
MVPGRHSSRRNQIEDLEELMMMEAIRLSIAAEEERKKKEEKEQAKEHKKEEKKKAKEAKKAEKAAKRSSFFPSASFERDSDSHSGRSPTVAGKGKGVDRSGGSAGFNPLNEPTSIINASSAKEDPQRHLEQSRAHIQGQPSLHCHTPDPVSHRQVLRSLSNASSSASSFAESLQGSLPHATGGFGASASSFEASPAVSGVSINRDETPPSGTPGTEPMFNFNSLAAVIGTDDDKTEGTGSSHFENLAVHDASPAKEPEHEDSEEGASSALVMETAGGMEASAGTITPGQLKREKTTESNQYDAKHFGDVSLLETVGGDAHTAR